MQTTKTRRTQRSTKCGKRFQAILLLITVIAITGCEQTIDPDNPFVERLVVNGTLTAGDSTIRVSFSKTLPLDRPTTREEGWLEDVSAVIVAGEGADALRLPLIYTGDSGVYAASGFRSLTPGRYRLEAEWHGLRVTAATTVPQPVSIEETRMINRDDPYSPNGHATTFEARFRPLGDAVYLLTFQLNALGGAEGVFAQSVGTIARRRDTLPTGDIVLVYNAYLRHSEEQIAQSDAVLHTIDAPYYDFHQTYYLDTEGDGPFSTGSDLTRWNVQGDGIGMFIGQAITKHRIG